MSWYYPVMVPRPAARRAVQDALARAPVASILGPRQCGKTTLARSVAGSRAEYFDLERPSDVARLAAPMTALEPLRGLVVLDEIQRLPSLYEVLRVLVDRPRNRARFLILGSADPRLVRGISESLAGRVAHVDIGGFDLEEVGPARLRRLWLRGGFPRSFLARSERAGAAWREDYIRDFLHRDLAQLTGRVAPVTVGRFWNMLAHFHGGMWNAAEFARSLGSSEATARHYLDLLTGAWLVRQLPPWFENLGKRQVRSPKVYVRDAGLLHALLGLARERDLMGHVKCGASWEGFAVEQVLCALRARQAYFWATHQGAELDLLVFARGKRLGFEMKLTDAPTVTKSMRIAQEDLRLDRLFVVTPSGAGFQMAPRIEALPLGAAPRLLARFR
jgi:predicted AAA+ superfamily ATPase